MSKTGKTPMLTPKLQYVGILRIGDLPFKRQFYSPIE